MHIHPSARGAGGCRGWGGWGGGGGCVRKSAQPQATGAEGLRARDENQRRSKDARRYRIVVRTVSYTENAPGCLVPPAGSLSHTTTIKPYQEREGGEGRRRESDSEGQRGGGR